ncbi:MAG: hypothetical protein JRI55_20270 [Deltaproteobacteria bacterium]|nr:hypothetical protein [Deltaproteobacteria bacterium]
MVVPGSVGAQPEARAPEVAEAQQHDDQDGDGFPDDIDECPEEPETRNGLKDDDGCPDGQTALGEDTDGDGLADHIDECPEKAETRNDFEDDDGCPDRLPDNGASRYRKPRRSRLDWKQRVGIPWFPAAQCRGTAGCAERGECSWVDDECAVGDDYDCRHSTLCAEAGRCGKRGTRCVAADWGDCKRSRECEEEGHCFLDLARHTCVDGPPESRPASSRNYNAIGGGIAMTAVGSLGVVGGIVAIIAGSIGDVECGHIFEDPGCTSAPDEALQYAGVGLAIGGAALVIAGIPTLVLGLGDSSQARAQKARSAVRAELRLAPTGGSLTWSL